MTETEPERERGKHDGNEAGSLEQHVDSLSRHRPADRAIKQPRPRIGSQARFFARLLEHAEATHHKIIDLNLAQPCLADLERTDGQPQRPKRQWPALRRPTTQPSP